VRGAISDGRPYRDSDSTCRVALPDKCLLRWGGEWAMVWHSLGGNAAQGLMFFEGRDILQDGFDYEFVAEF
jgi:hypothetical protein